MYTTLLDSRVNDKAPGYSPATCSLVVATLVDGWYIEQELFEHANCLLLSTLATEWLLLVESW